MFPEAAIQPTMRAAGDRVYGVASQKIKRFVGIDIIELSHLTTSRCATLHF